MDKTDTSFSRNREGLSNPSRHCGGVQWVFSSRVDELPLCLPLGVETADDMKIIANGKLLGKTDNNQLLGKNMKPLGEIEDELATKAEPVLGFKPSSKFKRGPIGILIYVLCGIVAFISMRSAGVF
jgi:hypothetical protein